MVGFIMNQESSQGRPGFGCLLRSWIPKISGNSRESMGIPGNLGNSQGHLLESGNPPPLQYSTVQYSTVLLYMCSKQEHKVDHGHKKGHAPRAQEGRSPTGISRPRTEVLRTQKPRIARAPELVRLKSRLFRENREMRETG